ncbi:MAG: hydrogenase formation protein HypD [Fidelibacterota bacterium]
MQYISDFRNPRDSKILLDKIHQLSQKIDQPVNIMEVCGGHTYAIFRFGINKALPERINLISGPGCPVCVTDQSYIDEAIEYAKNPNVIIATFGDIVRVPGSYSSLSREKSQGAVVEICYSPMEALTIAQKNPDKEVVFLGIGFETTVPLTATVIMEAARLGIPNFSILSSHKTMPNALNILLDSDGVVVNGLICPGHVSSITGFSIYEYIVNELKIPAVICGFESNDILQTILMILQQIANNEAKIENQYTRAVREHGNPRAQAVIKEVFSPVDSQWRGIGEIPDSGLEIAEKYRRFNVRNKLSVDIPEKKIIKGCICGKVMQGIKKPTDCKLFAKACTPQTPQGACMVSSEGGCATYYKFRE